MKNTTPPNAPKTITIQLSKREDALLSALAAKYGTLSTRTNICRAAMEAGMLRLAASLGMPFDGVELSGHWKDEEIRRALDPAPAVGLMRTALVTKTAKT